MRKLFGVALAALLTLVTGPASGYTAGEMLSKCSSFRDAREVNGAVRLVDIEAGVCFGAFLTIWETTSVVNNEKLPMLYICAPRGTTVVQFIRIFVQYAEVHPEEQHEPSFLIAADSLIRAFPCEGKTFSATSGWK